MILNISITRGKSPFDVPKWANRIFTSSAQVSPDLPLPECDLWKFVQPHPAGASLQYLSGHYHGIR